MGNSLRYQPFDIANRASAELADEHVEGPAQAGTAHNTTTDGVCHHELLVEGTPSRFRHYFNLLVWHGGSTADAWLTCTAAQVGQVILTLPYSFAQLGMAAGITLQVFYASMGAWTAYLLNILYLEYIAKRDKQQPLQSGHTIQYHEVIGEFMGPWAFSAALFFNIISLLGVAAVQIIACASDMYYLDNRLDKRTWSLLWSSVALLTVLLPSFHNYRVWSFVGLTATTFTAWYMVASSVHDGPIDGVQYSGPISVRAFFNGATNILFTFGGHAMSVEVMDAMWAPRRFGMAYFFSYLYVYTLTLPNATAMYWAYGDVMLSNSNALGVLPDSAARKTSIILMVMHQCVAFGLFMTPLYFMWEKLIGTHDRGYAVRTLSRVPVCLFVCFLAIAFPFFGPINSVMGAFCTTFSTYIVPAVAFNYVYRRPEARLHAAKQPASWMPSWSVIINLNWFIAIVVTVAGVGIGGWASIAQLAAEIKTFGVFDKCYMCHTTNS